MPTVDTKDRTPNHHAHHSQIERAAPPLLTDHTDKGATPLVQRRLAIFVLDFYKYSLFTEQFDKLPKASLGGLGSDLGTEWHLNFCNCLWDQRL